MTSRARRELHWRILAASITALLSCLPALGAGPGPVLSLGLALEASAAKELPPFGAEVPGPIVLLTVRWPEIEREAGVYDWSALEPAIQALHDGGYRVALCLTGGNPLHLPEGGLPSPANPGSVEAWLAFARSAVRSFGDRVDTFQVWDRYAGPAAGFDAITYAFLLKQSALALRAEARTSGLEIRVAQAATPAGDLAPQAQLWANDVAPYIDVLPVSIDAGSSEAVAAAVSRTIEAALQYPPAPALWAIIDEALGDEALGDEAPGLADPWAASAAGVVSIAAGAATAVLGQPAQESYGPRTTWALALHRVLADGYAPAPIGNLRLAAEDGSALGGSILAQFFSAEDYSNLVLYRLSSAAEGEERAALLVLDVAAAKDLRVLDPSRGDWQRSEGASVPGQPRTRAMRVPAKAAPLAARYQRTVAPTDVELPPEQLQIATDRRLTAEEIIARNQEVQRVQDDRLERWMGEGRIELHYKLAQGGASVDLAIESRYFWERGGQLEWEQTGYFLNGNKIQWKKIPELPLIQPEKVVTVPLDLVLDRKYLYRRVGDDDVAGRRAYVLEFQPADPETPLSLYRGRVWIDAASFVRLKVSLVQGNLEPPVLSNEEIDLYEERQGADGQPHRMLTSTDGQQVWTLFGRSFVVRRQLTFTNLEINPERPQFEERRRNAYVSPNLMLRDTEQGFRYLERLGDGTRAVKERQDTSQLFAAAGAVKDASTGGVTPLGGVNYVNYDLGGRNIQMNALFAGVFGLVTASKPDLFGGKMDASAEAALLAIKLEDKIFAGDDELVAQRVDVRNQRVNLRAGFPLGSFFKVNLVAGLGVREYFDNDDAARELARLNDKSGGELVFVLPADHIELIGAVEGEFNRRGYTLTGSFSQSRRSDWEAFGLFDLASGGFVEPEPVEEGFSRFGATAFKEWYLPKFQKLRGEVNYLDGSSLDRFSRYEFSLFGEDRLDGFSGSGVRFDDGLILRAGYSFNLFEVIRLDASVGRASVGTAAADRQSFTGVGLSANLPGPWRTVLAASYGRAVASDVPELDGEQEFMLLVLKLF